MSFLLSALRLSAPIVAIVTIIFILLFFFFSYPQLTYMVTGLSSEIQVTTPSSRHYPVVITTSRGTICGGELLPPNAREDPPMGPYGSCHRSEKIADFDGSIEIGQDVVATISALKVDASQINIDCKPIDISDRGPTITFRHFQTGETNSLYGTVTIEISVEQNEYYALPLAVRSIFIGSDVGNNQLHEGLIRVFGRSLLGGDVFLGRTYELFFGDVVSFNGTSLDRAAGLQPREPRIFGNVMYRDDGMLMFSARAVSDGITIGRLFSEPHQVRLNWIDRVLNEPFLILLALLVGIYNKFVGFVRSMRKQKTENAK